MFVHQRNDGRAPPPTVPELVATVGPASYGLIAQLVSDGATALRLNSSHLATDELARVAGEIRRAAPDVPLIIDLQGAKMRLGLFAPVTILPGRAVAFELVETGAEGAADASGAIGRTSVPEVAHPEPFAVPLPHPELFAAVRESEILTVDDGRLQFRVVSISRHRMVVACLRGGLLQPRKGVNRADHPVDASDLCTADVRAIESTSGLGRVGYALSFLRSADELEWVRRRADGASVIAKVERPEALDALPSLAARSDAVWICRGDLGVQVGMAHLARAVSAICPRDLACPVLMAGQVLEHLTHHGTPTRSEVCHLGDLLDRGYAGIVLSDETAMGNDPQNAVRTAAELMSSMCNTPPR